MTFSTPNGPEVGAVLINYTDDGRQSMAFVFDCAAWSPSCMLLGRLSVAWLLADHSASSTSGVSNIVGGSGTSSTGNLLLQEVVIDVLAAAAAQNKTSTQNTSQPAGPGNTAGAARIGGFAAAATAGTLLLGLLMV